MATTLNPKPFHPGMTPHWYDNGVHRAHMQGKVATPLSNGRWTVTSAKVPGLMYLTTITECSCKGHETMAKCSCRALVCFLEWLARLGAVQAEAMPIAQEA